MKYAITILMTLFAASAVAEEKSNIETCSGWSELAENIMQMRQDGTSMAQMMQVTDNKFALAMVRDAYDEVRYSSDAYQKKAVEDFRDGVFMYCLETLESD